jgi:hypothetical protein
MSHLTLSGRLAAVACRECLVPLTGGTVVVTRAEDPKLATTATKRTFQELSADEGGRRLESALASAEIGEGGAFSLSLQGEAEGALDVAVRLDRLDEPDADLDEPVFLHLTTVEPDWQQAETGFTAEIDYAIPSRYYCSLLKRWGWWLICGHVTDSGSGSPVAGLTVRAFDRDWLQDDKLGEANTDTQGNFRIWYQASDFTPTVFSPLINLEMTSGPDVYFEVETSGGNVVLEESPSTGRQAGRENVGHCFCVHLEVGVGDGLPYEDPRFTHVGRFNILTDFNSDGTANKSKQGAGGAGWGFHNFPKLRGFCPKTHPVSGQPMFYRFLYVDPVTSAEEPVTGDKVIAELVTSKLVEWDLNNDTVLETTYQDVWIAGSGATAPVSGGSGPLPPHVIVPDPNGWIAVDQDAQDDGFGSLLLRIESRKIVPGGGAPGSGAGNAPADPKTGETVTFIFETTTDPSDPSKKERQSQTVDVRFNNWSEVRQLDLQEFLDGSAGACTGLTSTVTVKYTVNHEFLAEWSLGMSSAASPWTAPSLPSGSGGPSPNPSAAATQTPIDLSSWPPCSYTVSLASRRALTDGESNDDSDNSRRTFCKT